MISSWKNFALLTGDGRETGRVAKGDSSQSFDIIKAIPACVISKPFDALRVNSGEIFFLCLKTPEIYLANSEVHLDCAKNVRE